MPIPSPNSRETEQDFVGRCVSQISDEYPQEQALAVCYQTYRESKMSRMSTAGKVATRLARIKINESVTKFKGINLTEDGEVNMEFPCWSGYRQYGTKIVDGKEVPDCRGPIEGVE
jgi:hypothetical protein